MSAEPVETKPIKTGKPAQASKPPVIMISSSVKPADASPAEPKSRTAIVRETCSRLSITEEQFGLCKKMAVWANVIPDAKISALSEDEFSALLDYVGKNYDLSA